MRKLENLEPCRVFYYFEQICAIPRGSGNMKGIADYCESFAKEHSLKYRRDEWDNVVIYKDGQSGSAPIILKGHLDMVCQKTENRDIDFLNDGIDVYADGDFIKARDTSLGADNGIAVAMILAILERNDIAAPPIEAVFTTDEEIGLIGASNLDTSLLSSKRMINLDSEEDDILTVSCAGGSDFLVKLPLCRSKRSGTHITLNLKGLKGGHSGVEIDKHRVNANILTGRFLNHLKSVCDFGIISIDGGDKANAIPNLCSVKLCCEDPELLCKAAEEYYHTVKKEINFQEESFIIETVIGEKSEYEAFGSEPITRILCTTPNGIMEMSAQIEGLVETSLNLGIMKTDADFITLQYALRSNIQSCLSFLEEKLKAFFGFVDCHIETFGHYPPWEFKSDSPLQELYKQVYNEHFGFPIKTQALHAGLECSSFAAKIEDIDCIAVGPNIFDVHSVNERLGITSVKNFYGLLIKVLEKCV